MNKELNYNDMVEVNQKNDLFKNIISILIDVNRCNIEELEEINEKLEEIRIEFNFNVELNDLDYTNNSNEFKLLEFLRRNY